MAFNDKKYLDLSGLQLYDENIKDYVDTHIGPASVAWDQEQESGTKIAEIRINGVSQDVYAPTPPNELADLADDSTHRLVTDTEKSTWNNKSDFDGAYDSLTGKPTLGTAAAKDVAASGDASTTQVVMGNDSRLTDSRPASDVSSWAKASTKPSYTASEVGAIATTAKGAANGVAELDSNGLVPASQLPSYVDDVLEFSSKSAFPSTGETGKIYVATDTNLTYRWSGTAYVEISPSLALGETSSTAYRGDRGKVAYDHSQSTHARTDATAVAASTTNGNIKINGTETTVYTHPGSGTNPHGTTKSDVGLGNVGNFKAVSTVASQGLTDTEKSNARANIGAGTSSLTIGTTSTTAAAGNHTHGVVSTSANGFAPKVTDTSKFLKGDGTWATPTDTKNTAGSTDTSSKIFLIGATSQAANPQTYSDNQVYATSGTLTSNKVDTKAIVALAPTGTSGSDKGSGVSPRYFPAQWVANAGLTVANGEVYFVKVPNVTNTYGIWLSLNNGTNYYPIAISNSTGYCTTHVPVNSVAALAFESAGKCKCYAKDGADATTEVTGCFRVIDSYDSNTTYSAMSSSELTTGTATTSRVVRADYLKTGIDSLIDTKIGALDVTTSGAGASKTLTALSETDGKISATFGNISITKSQVSDFPTSMTPTSHTHGNITNGGALQTNDITIASGDKLVVTDSSDSNKVARTSISFDGSTATKCLTQKGTWENIPTVNNATLTIQKNGTSVGTFTANASSNVTANIADVSTTKQVGTSSNGAVVVTHTAMTTGRYQLFAYGNGNGTPWFMEIIFGAEYVRGVVLCSSNAKVGVRYIDSTHFAIVSGTWDNVTVSDLSGYVSSVATSTETYTIDTASTYYTYANDAKTVNGLTVQTAVPANAVFTDTKNTAGSTDTSSKIFLVGATSQAANPQTYSHDTAYVGTDGCLYSGGTKVLTAHQDISGKVNKSGDTMTGRLTSAKPNKLLITGSGTTAQDKGSGVSPRYFPAKWTFNTGCTATDGDIITIKIPCAGHDYGVFVSIDNGTNYYPVRMDYGTGRLSTHYGNGQYITLIYTPNATVNNVYAAAGADARSNITGCWTVLNNYDTNTDVRPSAYCDTAADTAAKVASCSNYNLLANSYIHVIIVNANSSKTAITLNINGKGAKPIYINGTASSTSNYTLPAGSYLVYYNGTNYYFRTDGKITGAGIVDIGGNTGKFLRGDGTWQTPTNTTYAAGTGVTISGTNNAINVTYGTAANTACQGNDSRLSDSRTPKSHTHGNIQNGGTLQTNDITIANGDKIIVTDSSDSSKIARTSISFDGSTATQCLTKKGTWATFGTSNLALGTTSTTALKGDTKYAGASTAGGAATSAEKLGSSTLGGSNQPIYLDSGTAKKCNTFVPNSGGTFNAANGTAGAEGATTITIGNATGAATANNSYGRIRLYRSAGTSATTAYYTEIRPGANTANRTITFPNAGGTVALTSDLPVYSGSVSCAVNATTCTISNTNITTSSMIEPFSSNSSGNVIAVTKMVVTAGKVVLTFPALTEATSFKVRITNV